MTSQPFKGTWAADEEFVSAGLKQAQAWMDKGAPGRMPTLTEVREQGPEALLVGWLPDQPIIDRDTRVIAIGSCFAAYFADWLLEHDFNRKYPRESDDSLIRNPFESADSIAQLLRWAFGEYDAEGVLWILPDRTQVLPSEDRRLAVRDRLVEADVLIISLGFSEVWFDRETNESIWRIPPREAQATGRYGFRMSTAAETLETLETIERLRSAHLPNTKIIYTVSPQRAVVTTRLISPVVANTASKALIRAAVDDFLRQNTELLNSTYFYYPSYEIVTELSAVPFEEDNLHVTRQTVEYILDLFARHYTTAEETDLTGRVFPGHADEEYRHLKDDFDAKYDALKAEYDRLLANYMLVDEGARARLEALEALNSIYLRREGQLRWALRIYRRARRVGGWLRRLGGRANSAD